MLGVTALFSRRAQPLPTEPKKKLGPHPSSAASLLCAPVSQLVKESKGCPSIGWRKTPLQILSFLTLTGLVLCLRQGARAGQSGLSEKQAPSPLFQNGRRSHRVCDEPRSRWPHARVGKTCPRRLRPQTCQAVSHLETFACTRALCREASLYMPASSFANFRTQPVYPLLQEAFLGSLVRIKCPLSVFQRPWSLATEVVCPPVGFPYLTQPL